MKQAEKELVDQIYSTYNYIMLLQSQISSICELQSFSELKYEQFLVCYLPFSPKCTSVPFAEQTGPLACGICIRISIAKVFSGLNLIQIIQDSYYSNYLKTVLIPQSLTLTLEP